jgi:hypothetical protein
VLKSEKKAAEEAAKKEVISLEEFLETEVRSIAFIPFSTVIAVLIKFPPA